MALSIFTSLTTKKSTVTSPETVAAEIDTSFEPAPTLTTPPATALAIRLPVDAATPALVASALGGVETIRRILRDPIPTSATLAPVRATLRPCDEGRGARPTLRPRLRLLVKATRRSDGTVVHEVVAAAPNTLDFDGLADFQYAPRGELSARAPKGATWSSVASTQQLPPLESAEDLPIIPVPLRMPASLLEMVDSRLAALPAPAPAPAATAGVVLLARPLDLQLKTKSAAPAPTSVEGDTDMLPRTLSMYSAPVPPAPAPAPLPPLQEGAGSGANARATWRIAANGIVPTSAPLLLSESPNEHDAPFIRLLHALFAERPIWTSRTLAAACAVHGFDFYPAQKRLSPLVCYSFRAGPWRQLLIRLGYDPRTDPAARWFAMVDARAKSGPLASVAFSAASHMTGRESELPGTRPLGPGAPWQLVRLSSRPSFVPLPPIVFNAANGVLVAKYQHSFSLIDFAGVASVPMDYETGLEAGAKAGYLAPDSVQRFRRLYTEAAERAAKLGAAVARGDPGAAIDGMDLECAQFWAETRVLDREQLRAQAAQIDPVSEYRRLMVHPRGERAGLEFNRINWSQIPIV